MDVPAACSGFLFEGFRLDRNGGGLFRADDGHPVPLGSRALEILQLLVERHGQLVSKQQILDAVWPGLAVEEANLTVQVSAVRKALDGGGDRSGGVSCIQTVPGRGYRFAWTATRITDIGNVAPLPPHLPASIDGQPPPVPPRPPATPPAPPSVAPGAAALPRGAAAALPSRILGRPGRLLTVLAALGALLAAMLTADRLLASRQSPAAAAPPRLSVVVLPFENLSGDANDDRLADAITDDLTIDLSRSPEFIVVPHQSAAPYRGAAVDARKAGAELRVRYALKGTVRKLGETLRVNVQLIGTEGGANLWADRADEPLNSLSAGQEAAVARIAQTLLVALTDIESARSKRERPDNPDALDLIIHARSLYLHDMGPREQAERISLLERALQLDPTSIYALTELAAELIRATDYYGGDGLGRAASLIRAAAAINPNHYLVLQANAYLLDVQGRYAEAVSAYQRLVDEFPDDIGALSSLAHCLTVAGRSEEAVPRFEAAIRRGPRHPRVWSRYRNLGRAFLYLERNEEAIVWTKRALAANPSEHPPMRASLNLRLAAAHARLGQPDEARRAVAEANRIWPYATVRERAPDSLESPVYVAQMERYQAALRLAGLRDHAEEDADFGVVSDDALRSELAGPTPMAAPGGAKLIRTAELERLLAERRPVVVIDPLLNSWGRSIPGAIGLKHAGVGGSYSDETQGRLRQKMLALTKGDLSAPVVAVGFNSERFDGRNLAVRLVALGYTDVYWYRGGREAWEVHGLPETETDVQDW